MAPHPIIIAVLSEDRSRWVQAELTRQHLLAQGVEICGEKPSPHRPWVVRIFSLMSALRHRKSEATGAPA
jgi:hypothetical protein